MDALHLYCQECWHDDTYIVGTEETIRGLIALLTKSLEQGKAEGDFFCSDGEGYTVHVFVADVETMATKAPVPYTEEYAKESRTTTFHPSRLIQDD